MSDAETFTGKTISLLNRLVSVFKVQSRFCAYPRCALALERNYTIFERSVETTPFLPTAKARGFSAVF
jgi:hypothetical protein